MSATTAEVNLTRIRAAPNCFLAARPRQGLYPGLRDRITPRRAFGGRANAKNDGVLIQGLDPTGRSAQVHGKFSRVIRQTGSGEMSPLGKPACVNHEILLEPRERLLKWFNRDASDELHLIATKR